MIHGKTKRVLIAVLAVMMLVISSAFTASAASKTFSTQYIVGQGGFKATATSTTGGTSNNVTSANFTTSNHTTGISTSPYTEIRSNIAWGKMKSINYQSSIVSMYEANARLSKHEWYTNSTMSKTWYEYTNGAIKTA